MTPERRTALDAAIARADAVAPPDARMTALGWTTVDLERAEREFGATFADADDDVLLGARCRIALGLLDLPFVLLEPSTEGRLAGSLARLGEGPAIAWYRASTSVADRPGGWAAGPFGLERLLRPEARDGWFECLLPAPPATITP